MKKPKRKPKRTRYVTRAMLAKLRDEIEDLLTRCEHEISAAREYNKKIEEMWHRSTRHIETEGGNNRRAIEQMEIKVRRVLHLLGLEQSSSNAPAGLGEPVPWSYFHVWIARINERLEQLEKQEP
jgi:hypothetical protein